MTHRTHSSRPTLQLSLAVTLVTSLAAGCVAKDHVLGERTETLVSTSGGTALSADGLVRLDFPAGALATETIIVIETLRDTGRAGLLSEVYELSPDGLTFAKPVAIGFDVTSSAPVVIAQVDDATPTVLESVHDAAAGHVEALLSHFSSYAVIAGYDPCDGKVCGDSCDVCPPSSTCVPPTFATACDTSGQCVRDVPQLCLPPAPLLGVFPETLDFGSVLVGADASLSVTIANTGGSAATITNTAINPASPFAITSTVPTVVGPGAEETLSVVFHPVAAVTSSATLSIQHDGGTLFVNLIGSGALTTGTATDTFQQFPAARADILYVVGESSSMADIREALVDGAPSILGELDAKGIDYHLGVISTSTNGTALHGSPSFVTPSTPGADAALAANLDVAPTNNLYEIGLYATVEALTPPLSTGPNNGFIRSDATLTVVYISDGDDQGDFMTVQSFVDAIADVKSGHTVSELAIHAVTGGVSGCVGAAPSPRYTGAAQLGGGRSASICGALWPDLLSDPAGPAYGLRRVFRLSQPATGVGMSVFVDSVEAATPSEWVFDPALDAVVFTPSAIPPVGSTVSVLYQVL